MTAGALDVGPPPRTHAPRADAPFSYLPFDMPAPAAPDLWLGDVEPTRIMSASLPVRITVTEFENGRPWLRLPKRFVSPLLAGVEAQGSVRHLVAPNLAYRTFLAGWQRAGPQGVT